MPKWPPLARYFLYGKQSNALTKFILIMKKLILSAALLLGTYAASAQTNPETAKSTTTQTTQTQTEKEVKVEEVPAAVINAVKTGYPDVTINSVTVNAANEYTLNVTTGGKTGLVYVDANGKWITKE